MIRPFKYLYLLTFIWLFIGCRNVEEGGANINKSELVLNGIQKSFHSNGNVKTEATFVDDTLDGDLTMYYPDGTVHRKQFYRKGVRVGAALQVNPDSSLDRFDFYDSMGSLKYTRTYDTLNFPYFEQGEAIGEIVYSNDTCKVGDTLELQLYFAIPPDCVVNIEVTTTSSVRVVLDRTSEHDLNVDRFDYQFIVPEVDEIHVECRLELRSRIDGGETIYYANHSVSVIN